jgi:tRNA 2-thiouridine synthesizing protein E
VCSPGTDTGAGDSPGRQTPPALDADGFLLDPAAWTPALAELLARQENLELSADHWQVIHLLRAFYERYGVMPAMRVLVRRLGESLGQARGRSQHLLTLFPDQPLRRAARIAGLPRPPGCE